MVLPGELLDLAFSKNDKILIDMYTANENEQKAKITAQLKAGELMFSVFALCLIDYFAKWLGIKGTTVLQEVVITFGELGQLILVAGGMLGMTVIKSSWFTPNSQHWIYYPPLYNEIEAKRRSRYDLMSALKRDNSTEST